MNNSIELRIYDDGMRAWGWRDHSSYLHLLRSGGPVIEYPTGSKITAVGKQ